MKKGYHAFFPALILFLSYQVVSGQKIKLEFNPPVGAEYISEYDIQSSIDQTIMGIDQNVKAKTYMVIHSRITDKTEDYCLVEMKYKRLAVETSTAFLSMVIDSEEENEDNPVNRALKAMIDQVFTAKIGPDGVIINLDGMESMIEKIMSEIQINDKIGSQYRQLLDQSFGKDNLIQNMGMVSAGFPDYEIEKGSEWSYEQMVSASEFVFQLNTTAGLQDFNEKEARIIMRSEMNTPQNRDLEIQGIKARMALKGSQVGEINVDIETGISKSSFLTQNIDGMVELKMNENGTDTMTIPMKINSSIHVKTEIK